MALTKCVECGHQISKSATQCPNCGAKIRRTGLLTKIVAGLFALVFASMLLRQCSSESTSPSSTQRPGQPAAATQTPEQRAEAERARAEQEARSLGLKWRYDESSEQMGRGTVKQAQVNSLNELSVPWQSTRNPYATHPSQVRQGRHALYRQGPVPLRHRRLHCLGSLRRRQGTELLCRRTLGSQHDNFVHPRLRSLRRCHEEGEACVHRGSVLSARNSRLRV